MNSDSPKRQRFSPAGEVSHISDIVLPTSSSIPKSKAAPASNADSADIDGQDVQIPTLLEKIKSLELQLQDKEATETTLRQVNTGLELRCSDYESSIAAIQPRYQEALNDRGYFEHEFNMSLVRQTNLKKEVTNKDAEILKLREQKASVDAELAAARAALASSSVPELAEMNKLREELERVTAENEKLVKKAKNMTNDLDYMRGNYQTSSTLAAEHATENNELKTQVEALQQKADASRESIHQIQNSQAIKEYESRVRELKAENEELERALDKMGQELAAVLNGRRATRGTSVPRTPRMGSGMGLGAMSPGPAARSMGRVLQMGGNGGPRSRGNSPAPGEFTRNGGFGEPLFQDRAAAARWGNHLQ